MGTCNVFGYLNCVQLDVFEGFHPASHDDRQCFKINSNGVVVVIALGVNQSLEESDLAVHLFRGSVALGVSMLLYISHCKDNTSPGQICKTKE